MASERDDFNDFNHSALMNQPRRSRSGTLFQAWNFQVTVKADLLHCSSTPAKIRVPSEHLSSLTAQPYDIPSRCSQCFAMNLCSPDSLMLTATGMFQLWSTDMSRLKTLLQFPLCINLSILPPGNLSQEAWQAMQSSVPTVWGSPSWRVRRYWSKETRVLDSHWF